MTRAAVAEIALRRGWGEVEDPLDKRGAVPLERWIEAGMDGDYEFAEGRTGAALVDRRSLRVLRLFRALPECLRGGRR